MIEHIRTIGFKGFDLDEDVPLKAIYSGKNKSGKTTRAMGTAIALLGYIPFSTAGKRPGDILDSFGDGKLLVSAVKIGGKEFGRKFSRNEKGVVSMVMQHEGKRKSAQDFAILLDKAGAPRIADVAEFMKQSEAKKIDTLFDLFPNPELSTIDTEIETAKEDVSRLEKKKAGAESTVIRLTNSKQAFQIPAGSIAEVQDEINKVEIQIVELSDQIKQAEIEEAEAKATKKAEEEAEKVKTKAVEEAEEKKEIAKGGGMTRDEARSFIKGMTPGETHDQQGTPENDDDDYHNDEFPPLISSDLLPPDDPLEAEIQKGEQQIADFKSIGGFESKPGEISEPFLPDSSDVPAFPPMEVYPPVHQDVAAASIQRIIDALTGAGCGTCAALIVAKMELKKFKGVS